MAAVVLSGTPAAVAGPAIPRVPKIDPVNNTPRVIDDAVVNESGVRALRQVGTTMYAGGHFNTIKNAPRTATYTRHNIFSFNAGTRRLTTWAPRLNGTVYAIAPSRTGRYLFIGGDFTSYNGHPVNHLVKYDRRTNKIDTRFQFRVATTRISDLQVVSGRLVVAGIMSLGVVAVNQSNGARNRYFNLARTAGQETGYTTRVYRFAVNRQATRMAIIGSFTTVGGQPRQQAALLNLGPRRATVSRWTSPRWNEDCLTDLRFYTRDVDWSPDGTQFAIVTSGGGFPGSDKLCDSVSYWRSVNAGNQQPVWVNYSGGDTFHSVTVTNRGVFVSGHFRWLNNPQGNDSAGPGAVGRRGLALLNRANGQPRSWNPTKSLEGGLGGFQLYVTSRGLWVADFERYLGRNPKGPELHEGLGLFPL